MSDDPRHGLWDLLDGGGGDRAGLEAWIQGRQVAFEELCVRHVLDHFGLRGQLAAIRRASAEVTGKPIISFAWFHAVHPDFPVRMTARDIYKVHEVTPDDLAKRFTNTPIFKAYDEAHDEAEAQDGCEPGALATVYRPGGVLTVVHNHLPALDHPGFRMVRTLKRGQTYVIETLKQFLDTLTWRAGPGGIDC